MVAKMLALAMIVAAVGAAAIENPLAGDKSDSGIESPAAGSAEYGDAEEIHGRDLDKSDRGSIDYEDAEEIHGRALKKSWKKAMKQDLKEFDQRVESLERRSGAINLPGPPGKKGVPGEKGEQGEKAIRQRARRPRLGASLLLWWTSHATQSHLPPMHPRWI